MKATFQFHPRLEAWQTLPLLWAFLVLPGQVVIGAEAVRPATLTLMQIYEGARAARSPLNAVSVKYHYTTRVLGGELPQGSRVALGTWDVVFAFKGEQRIASEIDRTPGAENHEPGRTYVFDGETGYSYRPGSLMLFDGKVPNSEQSDTYCEEVLDIPVTDSARARQDSAWFYPHCLRPGNAAPDYKDYVVLPEQEQVDGAWCHVVDCAGRLKLWIDPQLGFALRRKTMFRPGGVFLADYALGKFEKAAPDLWIPWECKRLTNPFGVDALKLETVISVEKLSVIDQVTDHDFNIDVAPGTIVTGLGKGFVVQGDKSTLLDLFADDMARARESRGAWVWWVGLSVLIVAALMTLAIWVGRRRRMRTATVIDGAQLPS